MNRIGCKIKSYIQPFERRLALSELEQIASATPLEIAKGEHSEIFTVETYRDAEYLRRHLAYWDLIDGIPTVQAAREATVNLIRNGIPVEKIGLHLASLDETTTLPNRRVLRYGSHGIHEYRGKFFPQLVKALINIGGVPANGIIADPMCGSGTTILEAALAGYRGIGLDANPLSVFMTETKVGILTVDPDKLSNMYNNVREKILALRSNNYGCLANLPYFSTLPAIDQNYLLKWFSDRVLCDLDQIMQVILDVEHEIVRNLLIIAVSNILRSVSWQKEADLRVRKEYKLDEDIDPIRSFLDEIGKSVRIILAFLLQNREIDFGSYSVKEGSALNLDSIWQQHLHNIDAVITSPPYATALPYLDTDRLSLMYLGLLPRPEHSSRNLEMIGNREITNRIKDELWQRYLAERTALPGSVVDLIDKIHLLNSTSEVGFRRRNLPALLAKYFLDMRRVFEGMLAILKPGGSAYIVIGNNHTIAGGERVEIETTQLLTEVAVGVGFKAEEAIPMEMLVSRDIFRHNAVASEYIAILSKPA